MGSEESVKHPGYLLEENMKKALTEMLLLFLLSEKDCYIGELAEAIKTRSKGGLSIVFPYAAVYRLENAEYVTEKRKHIAPDGRRRQYFSITDAGRVRLQHLLETYERFSKSVAAVLTEREEQP